MPVGARLARFSQAWEALLGLGRPTSVITTCVVRHVRTTPPLTRVPVKFDIRNSAPDLQAAVDDALLAK